MINQAKINELAVKELERQLREVTSRFIILHQYIAAPVLGTSQYVSTTKEAILQDAEMIKHLEAEIKFITETGK